MRPFTYTATPVRVIFGSDTLPRLVDEVQRLGCKNMLVIASPEQGELAQRVSSLLQSNGKATVYPFAQMHTPVEATEKAMSRAKELNVDGLVAVGGGSAIGMSKAIAYRTSLPQLAIPTTYAGSEATTILGQTEKGAKTTLKDPRVAVKTILYDVNLTKTLPLTLSITSAINAMAHAVEALYSADANPIVDLMAVQGISTLRTALPRLYDLLTSFKADLEELDSVRSDVLYAAWLCGSCLGSVGMGLHHKLCHTLGGMLNTPHAQTHTVILPHALQYNFPSLSPHTQSLLREALSVNVNADDVQVSAAIFDLLKTCGAPTSLQQLNVQASDLARVAKAAATSARYPNPAPLDEQRLSILLEHAHVGRRPDTSF